MQPTTKYAIKARSYGVSVRAGVNGSATLLDNTGVGRVVYRQVNEWIRPEANELVGLISTPPGAALPDGTPAPPADAAVTISLYIPDESGEPIGGAPPLASFSWPLPVGPRILPFPFRIPFKIPQPVDTRLWRVAERVDPLTDADRREIIALVNRLRDHFAAGETAAAYELMRLRFEDEAFAEGFDPSDMRSVVLEQGAVYAKFKDGQPPLDARTARLTPVADNHLVLVTRNTLDPAITFEDETVKFTLEVYAAKVDGRWVVGR